MVRPVGRVTQAFSDGTLLLELVRPPNGPFGFVISRGKGRPDTGNFLNPHSFLIGVNVELNFAVFNFGDNFVSFNYC